jgi:transposase
MKKHSSISKSGEVSTKAAKPMRRESQEVMSELVAQLRKRLEGGLVVDATTEKHVEDWKRPNLDRLTVGVDVGDQWSNYCILGLDGETLAEGQFRTQPEEVAGFFHGLARSRVAMEVGTHSAWMREVIVGLGHEVLVANARRMQGSKRRRRKNDRIDAARLARLGRIDPQSLYPIQHRSTEVREDLLVVRAREVLVESRTKLINAVRSMVKTVGARVPSSSSDAFSRKAAVAIPEPIRETAQPLLDLIAQLSEQIKCYEHRIEQMAEEKYQHTRLLRQVSGVGPVTSMAYALTLETPLRFKKSRDVGPYIGLVPKQEDSGDIQPQLGISKAGDRMLRKTAGGQCALYPRPVRAGH